MLQAYKRIVLPNNWLKNCLLLLLLNYYENINTVCILMLHKTVRKYNLKSKVVFEDSNNITTILEIAYN